MRQLRERGEGLFLLSLGVAQAEDAGPASFHDDSQPPVHYRKSEMGFRVGGSQTSKSLVNLKDSCNLLSPKLTKFCSPNFNLQASQTSTNKVDMI